MMDKYVSVAEMIAVEKAADAAGLTYDQMMANAGLALAQAVIEAYSQQADKTILGLVGKGNNGGDTLVALVHLKEAGWETAAYIVGERPNDPLAARYLELGGEIVFLSEDKNHKKLKTLVKENFILMDGLLGTGIRLPLRDPFPKVLQAVHRAMDSLSHPPQIVAVDCPSGVDCENGEAAPDVIPADVTVCMAAVKQGLLAFPAYQYLGVLKVVGIGLPEELKPWKEIHRFVINREFVIDHLPSRPFDSHKGTFGTAMVIAGSLNFSGAVLLAGQAAFRSGVGWVTLAVPSSLHAVLAGSFPEATWLLLPQEKGVISAEGVDLVLKNLSRITAMLLGPGFGLEETTSVFIHHLLAGGKSKGKGKVGLLQQAEEMEGGTQTPILPPLVIDADGLKLLSELDEWPSRLPPQTILTPHPGEMSFLTGLQKDEIQTNRIEVAETYAKKWGHVVVLKGAFTVVAEPGGQTAIIPVATPALARAGTGDVLAGIITGLRAQGMEAYPTAACGAWLHAQAGLEAANRLGSTAGVLAGDLIKEIPSLLPR
jgi:NAD(P)H-hydrate epimerase